MELIKDLGYYTKKNTKRPRHYGLYRCPICLNPFKTRMDAVKSNTTKACNKCKYIKVSESSKTHGMWGTRVYGIYRGILNRCLLVTDPSWENYGGRGIEICDGWKSSFESFYSWAMKNGYSDDLSIDRIDVDGNYEPDNCRWTTQTVQSRNTRKIYKHNTSGFRGVSYSKSKDKWKSYITLGRKYKHIGYYETAKEAALAYDTFVTVYGLEHTRNFP